MAVSVEKTPEVKTGVNIDFLDHLAGESLTPTEVSDLRDLSSKYVVFAAFRYVLLGESSEKIEKISLEQPYYKTSNFFITLKAEIEKIAKASQDEPREKPIEKEDIEKANALLGKICFIAQEESSILMQFFNEKIEKTEVVDVFNKLFNKVKVILGGETNKSRRNTSQEAESLALQDTLTKYDGISETDLNRKKYYRSRLFKYTEEDSVFKKSGRDSAENKGIFLKEVQKEIELFFLSYITKIAQTGSLEEKLWWFKEAEDEIKSSSNAKINITGVTFNAKINILGVTLNTFSNKGPFKYSYTIGEDTNIDKPFVSERDLKDAVFYDSTRWDRPETFRAVKDGMHYLRALLELNEFINLVVINNIGDRGILTSPSTNQLEYFSTRINLINYGERKNQLFFFNGGYIVPYNLIGELMDWFVYSRINNLNFEKGGLNRDYSDKRADKLYPNWRKFFVKESLRKVSGKVTTLEALLGILVNKNLIRMGNNDSTLNFSNEPPNKDESASLIDQAIPKPVSFEIAEPWDLDIEYLAAYPDDGKPLTRYELPENASGTEYELKSRRAVPVEDRKFRVWAPINGRITRFSLNSGSGKEFTLGREYELEIDERGYYRASFKVGVSVPASVKYNFKFTVEPEKIDQVELDSQALLNLGIVAEKLDEAGYTNLSDRLKAEIKKGKIKDTSDIEKIVLNSSLYYYSELYSPSTIESIRKNHYPFLPDPTDNGKVVMVCSHAALLMKSIMSDVFPSSETHSTSLLVLRRTPLGHRLYATEDFHATLKGTVNGKNVSLDATPSRPALRFSTQVFRNIKEKFIEIYKRRKEGFMKAVSKSIGENKFNTFVVVNEKTRKERQGKVNKQYFSGVLQTYIETVASYEQAVTGTIKFRAPMVVTDVSKLIMNFDTEFQKDNPDITALTESVNEMKLRLKLSKEKVMLPDRRDVLDGKSYLGNATGYIGYLEGLVDNLELRLR